MKSRLCFAVVFLLASVTARAGDSYAFSEERHEGLKDEIRKGRVLVDGSRFRLELDPEEEPRPFDVLISKGSGDPEVGLTLADRTYYVLKTPDTARPSDPALWFYAWDRRSVTARDVKVDTQTAPEPETVSGLPTRRHEIHASYRLKVKHPAETMTGKVTIDEVFWMLEDRHLPVPSLLRIDIRTALPEIDGPRSKARSTLPGFPVRTQVTIHIDMGASSEPQTYTYLVTVQDLKPAAADGPLFEVPSGFRYEEPVSRGPGLDSPSPLGQHR